MRLSTRTYASILQLVLHRSLHVTVVRAQTFIVNVHKLNVHFVSNRESEMMIRVLTVDTSIYRGTVYTVYTRSSKECSRIRECVNDDVVNKHREY